MKKLDSFIARRRELVERYNKAFADCKNIVTPYQLPDTKSGWHLYIIQVKNKDRKAVFEALRAEGIGALHTGISSSVLQRAWLCRCKLPGSGRGILSYYQLAIIPETDG